MGGVIALFHKDVHQSWLIAITCCGIVLGLASAWYIPIGIFSTFAWLLTGIAIILFGLIRARVWVIAFVFVGGSLVGLWRGSIENATSRAYDYLIGKYVVLAGIVNDDTDINQRGQTVLRLRNVTVEGHMLNGSIWATMKRSDKVRRSDYVKLSGKMSPGFGTFAATMQSANLLVVQRPAPGDVALDIRDWFGDGVRKAISEPEASLGLGYLVGQRRGLPQKLDAALKAAGLTHIVVASGYNLTILVRLSRRLFEKISKYMALISSMCMIVAFMSITGLSPSMSRAGLVAGLSLLAWYYGRRFHPLILLPLAMAITALWQPSYVWGDLGWQLSFAAFAGVMIFAPLVRSYFFGDKPERSLRRILIETISAQIWTLPILLLAFGKMSIVAPIANLLILPLVPLAMLLTFIAGIGGIFIPSISVIIGMPARLLLTYMTSTAMYVGDLPWATQALQITPIVVVVMYAGIVAFTGYMYWRTHLRLDQTSLVE